MSKRNKARYERNEFLVVQIVNQSSGKDVWYRDRAPIHDREKIARLLRRLYFKGVAIPPRLDE